jgi:hypothetical protein
MPYALLSFRGGRTQVAALRIPGEFLGGLQAGPKKVHELREILLSYWPPAGRILPWGKKELEKKMREGAGEI